ncbi:leucine-zipper-like transcriptional regulator 1 [Hyposmocoma kahamanoa]|uniref:leucine-zipper-like transcriptional regulator 1 n=1 Tax=Hyposmocoma kahamanoa TaxID=1477025 RepID=UPI000E6D70A5|nr:leucine-zipper-like transcriptional regulator 1 [Hyposmocoma kahamanoa]
MWSPVDSGGAVDAGTGGTRTAAAPCSRGKHSATLVGSYVYILGGRGAGGSVPLRDFWRFHLGTGNWERLETQGEAPPALQEHTATAHGSKLYVFGGEAGSISTETPLWIYDTETSLWRKLVGATETLRSRNIREQKNGAISPRGRRGHSAHALKDCLLIYGGYKDFRGSTNELWAFHYETEWWQQVRQGNAGPARHRHAAALHDSRLYVHGGQRDLRDCADLWHYDTLSRMWTQVRTPAKTSPAARSGHAGLRAGAHFYIFGGEVDGHPTNELWRFHFATETWERVAQGLQWPLPRVDCAALLVPGAGAAPRREPAPAPRPEPPAGSMRELSKLPSFRLRRAARCSYSVLGERDSTESLPRDASPALPKSRSSAALARPPRAASPREADEAERPAQPASVPDFADVALASDEDEGPRRPPVRKSASVRFTADDEGELSTSDYASAEAGFANPHYLGPDVRGLGAALTPDSGVAPGDIELQELRRPRPAPAPAPARLHLLLVGGKDAAHPLLRRPLSLWTYRLL